MYVFVSLQDYFEFPASAMEISEEARTLITGLLCDRNERLGANGSADFRSHPFFSGLEWSVLHQLPAPYQPEVSNATDTSNFDVLDDCLSETVHKYPLYFLVFYCLCMVNELDINHWDLRIVPVCVHIFCRRL